MSYLNEKWFMYIYDNSCRKIDEDKNNSKKLWKISRTKIWTSFLFAEGLLEHLYIGKVRQFHKLIQPKLSDNSFKKNFTVFST